MKLKLKKPEYNNEVVIELQGDYNDGDYTYDTVSTTVQVYEIVFPILKRLTGSHNWEKYDRLELAEEALNKLGILEDSPLYEEVMDVIDSISLYSDSGGCHTLYINNVFYQSKDDSIRYIVE
jgi:hypothetical protein